MTPSEQNSTQAVRRFKELLGQETLSANALASFLMVLDETLSHHEQEVRERLAKEISWGGTENTILFIQHNGESFVNERQVLSLLRNKTN